jgi:hypothetical protein
MPPLRPQSSIPVLLMVKSAYQVLWQQRDDALRLGLIPTLICFGGFLYGQDAIITILTQWQAGVAGPPPDGAALSAFATLLIVLLGMALAIGNWLRFLLLGPMGAIGLGLAIGRPHVNFLVSSVLLVFGASIAFAVLSMPVLLLPGIFGVAGAIAILIAVTVVTARLSPFVVAQVIAQPMSLQEAWQASRGNGVALTTALILVQVPLWIVVSLLNQILLAVGFAAVAPFAMLFITAAFEVAMSILQASVLAAAFRQMVGIRA